MRLACFFLLLTVGVNTFAQTENNKKYLGSYTQPAPNVASLGKFVDCPVSFYTGTPDISIPIYELQDGAAKTSISLSYHASGIRVAELASWIGLGWALNAGGMITRTVRGGPDDGTFNFDLAPGKGYYVDSGIRKIPKLPYPVGGTVPEDQQNWGDYKNFWWQLSAGQVDGEPDMYTFNMNGYSGKFMFDEFRTPRMLTDQDVKITVVHGGEFKSWTITTPDGTRYLFGENDVREVNQIYSTSGPDNNSLKPASWLLTKVIYPNSKDTIYYDYSPETYSYFDLGQEMAVFTPIWAAGGSEVRNACQFVGGRPGNVYKTTVSGYRLTRIRTRNYRISFGVNTSMARIDLLNGVSNKAYMLDSIKIYNNQNQCLKQFVLSHNYFRSTLINNVSPLIPSFTLGDTTDNKRLKFTAIQEFSGDGLTSKPAYKLTYQETAQLPRRLTYDIDHWGYSNYSNGDRNQRFTPTVKHGLCNSFNDVGANREASWPAMLQFSIKSLQDPLGVLTHFEFEQHVAEGAVTNVGGLRIKKITNTDSLTGKSIIRNYTYGSGGTLYKVPQYIIDPLNEYYFEKKSSTASYRGYALGPRTVYCVIRNSQSIVPLQDLQGNHIGYSSVKESFGTNGEGGYKVYGFFADRSSAFSSRLDISNYTAYASIQHPMYGTLSGYYGNGYFNEISPENLVYYTGMMSQEYYPEGPAQIDFRRGQVLYEETFDSTNNLLRQVKNEYTQKLHENYWLRGLKLFRSQYLPGGTTVSEVIDDAITFYKLRTGISQLSKTVTIDYKDNKPFTTFTCNFYESDYHTNKTGDSTINSTGDTIVTKTYYTPDYTNTVTGDNVFGKMAARNMILPVATRVWKNGKLISGTTTLYKDFATAATDTFINPHKIYALETADPMSPATVGEAIRMIGKFSTLVPHTKFKEQAVFNVNGSTGKIIEQRLVTDKNQALIWDASTSLPLAQADNAMFSEIAYSSFETAEKGNWTYTGSPTTDATSPTGTKAYPAASGASKSGLTSAKKYIVSYWYKSGTPTVTGGTQSNSFTGRVANGWTYRQVTVTGTTGVTIGGTGSIDELRIHPELSQMTSYTYDPLLRLTAMNSPNNTVSYYEYDSMNRVVAIRDQFGNVIKAFEYNYGGSAR